MEAAPTHESTIGGRVRRVVIVLLGAAVFLGVASVIKPDPRSASAGMPTVHDVNTPQIAVAKHPKGWKLIGSFEGREHLVKCWATPDGPRYSVYTLDGRLLQADLPADEVYRGFPDVDLQNLRADPPTPSQNSPVMLVEPARD